MSASAKAAPVRLRAADADDLAVVAALVQDALVPPADIAYLPDQRRFVLALNRYRGEVPSAPSRTHALLSFEHVDRVQSRGLNRRDKGRILNLLTIAAEAEGRSIRIEFAGGDVAIKLSVGAIDGMLQDVGESWPAAFPPRHDLGD